MKIKHKYGLLLDLLMKAEFTIDLKQFRMDRND
ncbi:hypothetical protein J2Z83_003661 [Virgibacillus natechei]|uniref:Uncharacterized protein n=1 Tax=Virgibacillus natechei TaxID=1216297 RepID=A0ABS4ILR7_9BACI|nr:hypothetical protein [Virgibacillus natechei]